MPSHLSRTALTNKSSVWTGGTEKRTTYFYATSSRDDEVKTSLTNRVLIDDPGNQKKVDVKKKTSLCLPTVFLPDELQKSIDIVLASEWMLVTKINIFFSKLCDYYVKLLLL